MPFLRLALSAWVGISSWAGAQELAPAPPRGPNVLLIAIDDLNAELGCLGGEQASTPAIDRLAKRGVSFVRAYCQYPLCNPSRVSLFTGMRPERTRVFDLKADPRTALPDTLTCPELFKQAGWFTARVGKVQHRNEEGDDPRSWDATVAVHGRDDELASEVVNLTPRMAAGWALAYLETDVPGEELDDGRTASAAIALIEEQRDKPFFLAVGFVRPHVPFIAPREYFALHPLEQVSAPGVKRDDLEDVPTLALNGQAWNWGLQEREVRLALRGYRAATSFMDAQVGRVLDALERLDLTENTIVVLFSDHGYLLGEHGQWGKWSLFEPSARVPLVISAPGFAPGVSPRTVELLDLYPTLADLCGLAAPEQLEGVSLRPLLTDPAHEWTRPAFTQLLRQDFSGWSVRTERWRYSEWEAGAIGRELYDHDSDPGELVNLAERPEHAKTVADLAAEIAAVRK